MTTKDIAKLCGVSTATVSNIINGKGKASPATIQKVMEIVEQHNYKPNYIAQGLRKKVTNTIGVVAEDIAQFTTPDILDGVMAECEENGYRVIVENLRFYSRWRDQWYDSDVDIQSKLMPALEELKAVRVDGAIYIAGHAREIKGFAENLKVPNVIAYAFSNNKNTTSIMIDDIPGGYDMTKYLLGKGHKRIGFLGGRSDNLHTMRRLEGYKKALAEAGIDFEEALVEYADWSRESACECMHRLLDKSITAVFCMSDTMCGGIYDCLDEKGLIPGKDVSVAGYDDSIVAGYFKPGLTTMAINLKEIGRIAAQKLISMMKEEADASGEKVYIPCKLVERNSVSEMYK